MDDESCRIGAYHPSAECDRPQRGAHGERVGVGAEVERLSPTDRQKTRGSGPVGAREGDTSQTFPSLLQDGTPRGIVILNGRQEFRRLKTGGRDKGRLNSADCTHDAENYEKFAAWCGRGGEGEFFALFTATGIS